MFESDRVFDDDPSTQDAPSDLQEDASPLVEMPVFPPSIHNEPFSELEIIPEEPINDSSFTSDTLLTAILFNCDTKESNCTSGSLIDNAPERNKVSSVSGGTYSNLCQENLHWFE